MEPDGNLLDSVGGDTSLANEWSLPVLPEGVGHVSTLTLQGTLSCAKLFFVINVAMFVQITTIPLYAGCNVYIWKVHVKWSNEPLIACIVMHLIKWVWSRVTKYLNTHYTHTIHTGNSSHPSTSQELADIFGTSDDEDDVDFPFVLSSELPVPKGFEDIALAGGPENSLLGNTADSELFLAGFQPSPNKDSNDLKSAPPKKEEEKKKYDKSPPESKEDKIETEEKQDGDKKEVKTGKTT